MLITRAAVVRVIRPLPARRGTPAPSLHRRARSLGRRRVATGRSPARWTPYTRAWYPRPTSWARSLRVQVRPRRPDSGSARHGPPARGGRRTPPAQPPGRAPPAHALAPASLSAAPRRGRRVRRPRAPLPSVRIQIAPRAVVVVEPAVGARLVVRLHGRPVLVRVAAMVDVRGRCGSDQR